MLKRFIAKVAEGQDLPEEEAAQAMAHIMEGEGLPTQIASFLTALRMKGETIQEITGFARTMRARAVRIQAREGEWVVDTCGTGGDGVGTFNISTAVALVAAGGDLTVAKHGNRSVSSQSGSADVLEALGVNLALHPERVEASLQEHRLAFLFAPTFHPAMKHAVGPRKEIGIRTVFNLLGPLTNPAGATVHLLGVYREDLTRPVAEVLKSLGSKAAFVVHGIDHSDEISITGKTIISRLQDGAIEDYQIEPEDAGLKKAKLEAIRGGKPNENAYMIKKILAGEDGPRRDAVLLNAAAVFVASGKVSGLKEGVKMARESIDSGKAKKKLEDFIRFSGQRGL
ncbi:MAG TPA: anthranilate phosphoribosyltransferase [Thermodesulfobacteriota bacterium]|nr:anthranilate phosphoribosyltransferase [Thermodesulfobacteriota bacterium]